jgi:putative oxidoreductase
MLLILLFAYTGTDKLLNHHLFLGQLKQVTVFHNKENFISYFIPIFELMISVLLLFNKSRATGLILSAVSMLVFTLYVIFILSGDHIPCSCGGIIAAMSWTQHLVFNIIFFIFSITSLYYHKFLHVYEEVS